jgi:hypothetical protein
VRACCSRRAPWLPAAGARRRHHTRKDTHPVPCAARADAPLPALLLPRPRVSGPPAPLLTLARDNLAAEIRAAVAAGADVNAGNAIAQRALHIAALHGNVEAMEALLDCGADPNVVNERSMTPLVCAARGCAVVLLCVCAHSFCACVFFASLALCVAALCGERKEGQRAGGVRAAGEARRGLHGARAARRAAAHTAHAAARVARALSVFFHGTLWETAGTAWRQLRAMHAVSPRAPG